MLRFLWFVAVLAAITAAAVWIADHPGNVTIRWQNYALDTSMGVLATVIGMVSAAAALGYHFWRWLRTGPRRLSASRAAKRRERGYKALTDGLVAVAAGDVKSAQRLAKESARLIDNPFKLLLLAQAAQLGGDETATRRHFGAMLEHPETEFLGLRGLLVQASKDGDWAAALDYARRAFALRPEAEWASTALFDLAVRGGEWREAQKALESAARHKHVGPGEAPRRRAVLLAERARTARAEGRDEEALSLARESHKLAPGLVAAATLAAGLLAAAGKTRAATRLIEESWERAPHPGLAAAWIELVPDETTMRRLKRVEQLMRLNPEDPESHITLARAALDAEVWGAARSHLEAAAKARPTQRVFRLLAELEEREDGATDAARAWLLRAASAPGDAAWLCDKCGAVSSEWHARCGACNAFDSLAWRSPPATAALDGPPTARALPAARDQARKADTNPSGRAAPAATRAVDAVPARE